MDKYTDVIIDSGVYKYRQLSKVYCITHRLKLGVIAPFVGVLVGCITGVGIIGCISIFVFGYIMSYVMYSVMLSDDDISRVIGRI